MPTPESADSSKCVTLEDPITGVDSDVQITNGLAIVTLNPNIKDNMDGVEQAVGYILKECKCVVSKVVIDFSKLDFVHPALIAKLVALKNKIILDSATFHDFVSASFARLKLISNGILEAVDGVANYSPPETEPPTPQTQS